MEDTRLLMGMPVTVRIVDTGAGLPDLNLVYDYFTYVDNKFSPYKDSSEISQINNRRLKISDASADMQTVLNLCDRTNKATFGYFEIDRFGHLDPSGLVKGWAIRNAAGILTDRGFKNFYIDAGGDIQVHGLNSRGQKWRIGIENPFDRRRIVKALQVNEEGVATSGTYLRGQHIYNPKKPDQPITEIVSLTVVGPDIYEADRFATAAFAMGKDGIRFIGSLPGFAGYMIDKDGIGTETSNFPDYDLTKS